MLKISNLGFYYKDEKWLFRHLNFTFHRNEIVGIYGDSGIGKSTFAKLIAGYLQPREGEIITPTMEIRANSKNPIQLIWQHPERAINPKWKLAKVFQEADDLPDNIQQLLSIKDDWLNRYPHELSGGELQRFCIARSLGKDTRFIVADEITSMFDAITQASLWHMLLKLVRDQGIGMIVISHQLHLLKRLADRIIHFNELIAPQV